jgi:lactobin A/cerein 7B family class IIb bacteriocin
MELSLNINGLQELSVEEQRQIDGGWILAAVVIVIIVAAFVIGVYNGYEGADNGN